MKKVRKEIKMASSVKVRENEAKSLVAQKIKQIEVLTGSKKKASAYASSLMTLANNKNLKNCSVESILHVGFEIIQAGLNPNPIFGQAYVVPFKSKYGEVAQLQIGYKGQIALGYRAGWIFKAVPIYQCDDFSLEFNGFEDIIHLKPNYEERNSEDGAWVYKNLVGVIIYAKDKLGNIFTEFVDFKKLEKIRVKSANQKAGQLSYIWLEWAEEMYKAKALKYVITRLPITEDVQGVILKEDEAYTQKPVKAIEKKEEENDVNALIMQNTHTKEQPLLIEGEVEITSGAA